MSWARTLRTARPIPPRQLAERARTLLRRRLYALRPAAPVAEARTAAEGLVAARPPRLPDPWLAPWGTEPLRARAEDLARGRFTFLRRTVEFPPRGPLARSPADPRASRGSCGEASLGIDWDAPGTSLLWRYQLQYLGPVLDLALAGRDAAARDVLASWIARHGDRWDPVAWHPYPVAVRVTNLCLAAGVLGAFEALGADAARTVAVQSAHLAAHLEHDVRGNHLLENLFALLVASRSFGGPLAAEFDRAARAGLAVEVPEQVLPDGGHFELSPMYHSHVLHRLLGVAHLLGGEDALVREVVGPAVVRMRAFLAGILCPDGEIPILGDSARGFAPPAATLLGDVRPEATPGVRSFPDSGLHVVRSPRIWAILDAGPVCPAYLPAHGQADTLTVEVWCDGACVVGDPGVFDYSGPERSWGRSSRAHSTVTVEDRDTSEVYASFRVGGRATVPFVEARPHEVTAAMVPFGGDARFTRIVQARGDGALRIVDDGRVRPGRTARSRLHLHPGVGVDPCAAGAREVTVRTSRGRVRIVAAHPLRLEAGRASREFGLLEPTTLLVQDLLREEGRDDVHGEFTIEALS